MRGSKMKRPPRRRWTRYLLYALGLILLFVILVAAGISIFLRGSLSLTEGQVEVADLDAPVEVERDAEGIVTIRAENRLDVAFATGFVHAQERFFQMDLARRRAAGELAGLLGKAGLRRDRSIRPHGLRQVAQAVLAQAEVNERILVERYAAGARAGLDALRHAPFEYGLLGIDPEPWQAEDSYLVLLSMFLELEDENGGWEQAHGLLHNALSPELYRFLTPTSTSWDAPLLVDKVSMEEQPTEEPSVEEGLIEERLIEEQPLSLPTAETIDLRTHQGTPPPAAAPAEAAPIPGSNVWAIAGHRTRHGRAIVANDMHLGLSLPNIWFRASFSWRRGDHPEAFHQVTGATLPGLPAMVIGSNRHVAWGLANGRTDTSDVVFFLDGEVPIEERTEILEVRGQGAEELTVRSSPWGPVLDRDRQGRNYAVRWVAHYPEAVDLRFLAMETAVDVEEALAIGRHSGMPALSLVVGDADGRIGWTYTGQLPRRQGFGGHLPNRWDDEKSWDGWLEPAEVPRQVDPESGVLWAANNRLVDGAWLDRVGDGGYSFGARAQQIRDQLFTLETAEVDDMLAIQLDDRALYLEPWRHLLLDTLAETQTGAELGVQVKEWDGRAIPSSPAYRAVYRFRRDMLAKTLESFLDTIPALDDDFPAGGFRRQWQDTALRILQEKPEHLLAPEFETWDALLLTAAKAAHTAASVEALRNERGWRPVQIRHPLSRALPGVGRWLDIEPTRLPGGPEVPRLQLPRFGASQRMAVAPGKEEEAYFQMPGGQSGHPLSPFYRNLQDAWANGHPTPFLPGPAVTSLRLQPENRNPSDHPSG